MAYKESLLPAELDSDYFVSPGAYNWLEQVLSGQEARENFAICLAGGGMAGIHTAAQTLTLIDAINSAHVPEEASQSAFSHIPLIGISTGAYIALFASVEVAEAIELYTHILPEKVVKGRINFNILNQELQEKFTESMFEQLKSRPAPVWIAASRGNQSHILDARSMTTRDELFALVASSAHIPLVARGKHARQAGINGIFDGTYANGLYPTTMPDGSNPHLLILSPLPPPHHNPLRRTVSNVIQAIHPTIGSIVGFQDRVRDDFTHIITNGHNTEQTIGLICPVDRTSPLTTDRKLLSRIEKNSYSTMRRILRSIGRR